jgi:hypothetical protein
MMGMTIDRAIFITNTFADAYPEAHIRLWEQFEKEVPASKRSGHYGADNVAYVNWLKKKNPPEFQQFIQNHIDVKTL